MAEEVGWACGAAAAFGRVMMMVLRVLAMLVWMAWAGWLGCGDGDMWLIHLMHEGLKLLGPPGAALELQTSPWQGLVLIQSSCGLGQGEAIL